MDLLAAMGLEGWISLVTCTGHLALTLLILLQSGRGPLAFALSLWCLDQFAWNFASFAYTLSGQSGWHWLDVSLSPFSPPLALHVILAFVGRSRPLRRFLVAAYAAFFCLAASDALAYVQPWARAWVDSAAWALVFLVGEVVVLSFAGVRLVAYLREVRGAEERIRARVMLAALIIGAALTCAELLHDVNPVVPALGNLGSLIATILVTTVSLRFRLLGSELPLGAVLYAMALASLGVLGHLAILRWLGNGLAVVVVGSATVTMGIVATTREVVRSLALERAALERLAGLGRFSAQLAHDLKNPLAALNGAIQYILGDAVPGRLAAEHREYLDLVLEQVERLRHVVETYERLGRVEPVCAPVKLNDLIKAALAVQQLSPPAGVEIRTLLSERLPICHADPDLLVPAVENLIKNALEAMGGRGTLTIRTESLGGISGRGAIAISVEDTGTGMDARQQARVFDEFYTTKARGSGLGLSFVQRVTRAHGGDVTIASRVGVGTIVRVQLPCR